MSEVTEQSVSSTSDVKPNPSEEQSPVEPAEAEPSNVTAPCSPNDGSNPVAIENLLKRTGYPLVQENGQRRYGPPLDWAGELPCRGCEVFVGKIPRDCYEDELVPVLEKAGSLYECRIMVDFDKGNRGFCFATYATKEEAKRAVKQLNNYEIREKRYIGVCQSVDNCRLFVGGIPLDKKEEDVTAEMSQITEGVVKSIVYPSVADKTKNRGFAFVEYESHKAAAVARRKLMPGKHPLWGQQVAVDWAEPEPEVDEDIMSKVKIAYVRNLMASTTEETIMKAFQDAIGKTDAIEKVKKLKDYAFVHFKEREDALVAIDALNETILDGSKIVVVLAKPPTKENTSSSQNHLPRVILTPGHHPFPHPALLITTPTFYPIGAHIGKPLAPRTGNGCSKNSPDGYLSTGNYLPNTKVRGQAGARKAGGMSRSYGKNRQSTQVYDLRPGTELIPINPHTFKPIHVSKSPVQALEEYCQRSGWDAPIYQLHSTLAPPGDQQLFVFKVYIPNASVNPFMPVKLCRNVEDAKKMAAENVLLQFGLAVPANCATPYFPTNEFTY